MVGVRRDWLQSSRKILTVPSMRFAGKGSAADEFTGKGSGYDLVAQKGFRYSHKFTKAGKFEFTCLLHEFMKGVITVV